MVNRQCSGGHWPWSGHVWLPSSSAPTRSSLGAGEPFPGRAGVGHSSLPLLPVCHQVCLNEGPPEKDCLSLCVCTAPIASAIIGIKVNKSRNGSNLWYRSQWLGRRIYPDKWTQRLTLVRLGARGQRMARDESSKRWMCPIIWLIWLWGVFRGLTFFETDNKMYFTYEFAGSHRITFQLVLLWQQ